MKDLKLTSVDLVDAGANPDAFIRLFKRKKKPGEPGDSVKKEASTFAENMQMEELHELAEEMFDFSYAFSDSLASIIWDEELDEPAKLEMMYKSLDEFAETIRNAAPVWASGKRMEKAVSKKVRPESQKQAFEAFWKGLEFSEPTDTSAKKIEEEIDLKIDKSKMTAEEQAQLADFEKRYGVEEPAQVTPPATVPVAPVVPAAAPEIHPDVKKALAEFEEVKKAQAAEIQKQKDELEALRKRVEIEQLVGFAKKYELIGKKSDELATKLYDLKKAGGTAYDDYVALLDEHLTTVEKSGLFREIGKNTTGGGNTGDKLKAAASEIAKSGNVKGIDAIIKAFEDNPELAAQYEDEYMGGN